MPEAREHMVLLARTHYHHEKHCRWLAEIDVDQMHQAHFDRLFLYWLAFHCHPARPCDWRLDFLRTVTSSWICSVALLNQGILLALPFHLHLGYPARGRGLSDTSSFKEKKKKRDVMRDGYNSPIPIAALRATRNDQLVIARFYVSLDIREPSYTTYEARLDKILGMLKFGRESFRISPNPTSYIIQTSKSCMPPHTLPQFTDTVEAAVHIPRSTRPKQNVFAAP